MSTSDTPHDTRGTDPEPESGPVDEMWVYGGVRIMRGGKKGHLWLTDHGRGEGLLYAKTTAAVVGGLHTVAVSRTDDTITVHGSPTYRGTDEVDPDLMTRLHAEHQAAKVRLAQARRERQAAKHDRMQELLEPLQAIMRALPTRADRAAFLAHVLNELSRH